MPRTLHAAFLLSIMCSSAEERVEELSGEVSVIREEARATEAARDKLSAELDAARKEAATAEEMARHLREGATEAALEAHAREKELEAELESLRDELRERD